MWDPIATIATIANTIIIGWLTRKYVHDTRKLVGVQQESHDAAMRASRQAMVFARLDFLLVSGGNTSRCLLTVVNTGPHTATAVHARLVEPNDVGINLQPLAPIDADELLPGEVASKTLTREVHPGGEGLIELRWTDGNGITHNRRAVVVSR